MRGEVEATGPDGKKYKLCLTLGAMAQIEQSFNLDSFDEIHKIFEKPSIRKVNVIWKALLAGGGNPITEEDLMSWPADLQGMMESIKQVFDAAKFGEDEPEKKQPAPQRPGKTG